MYTAGTSKNIIGMLNEHECSIVSVKTLRNLRHSSLGLMMSASPSNPSQLEGGGTAQFRNQKLIQWGSYTKANRENAGDLPKSEILQIPISGAICARYELETLDLKKLDVKTRSEFISYIQSGIQTSLAALLDAFMLDLAVEEAKKDKAQNELVISGIGDLATESARTSAFRKLARARNDIAEIIDEKNIGSELQDFGVFLKKNVLDDLLLAMPKGGDSATFLGKKLSNGMREVAGLGIVKTHLFFNKKIDAGTSFAKEKPFDFTNVYGLIVHREALFLAITGLLTSVILLKGSHNQEYLSKTELWRGVVRPELFKVIRSVASTT